MVLIGAILTSIVIFDNAGNMTTCWFRFTLPSRRNNYHLSAHATTSSHEESENGEYTMKKMKFKHLIMENTQQNLMVSQSLVTLLALINRDRTEQMENLLLQD